MRDLKQVIPIFICFIVFISCAENKSEKERSQRRYSTEDFTPFFDKFCTIPSFQESRVSFPLNYSMYEFEDETMHTVIIEKKDWKYTNYKLDTLARYADIDRFTTSLIKKTDTVIYQRSGIDNGINMEFIFTPQDEGKWFLTRVNDFSN